MCRSWLSGRSHPALDARVPLQPPDDVRLRPDMKWVGRASWLAPARLESGTEGGRGRMSANAAIPANAYIFEYTAQRNRRWLPEPCPARQHIIVRIFSASWRMNYARLALAEEGGWDKSDGERLHSAQAQDKVAAGADAQTEVADTTVAATKAGA